jgi:hypothetical protein
MKMGTEMTLGESFARALGAKDFDRVGQLLHEDVDFRGLTPGRSWTAQGAEQVVGEVLTRWFEPDDEIEQVQEVQTGGFADRSRVGYRFAGRNGDGPFVVEQQAYYAERDGRIGWMRVVCSGFRPA